MQANAAANTWMFCGKFATILKGWIYTQVSSSSGESSPTGLSNAVPPRLDPLGPPGPPSVPRGTPLGSPSWLWAPPWVPPSPEFSPQCSVRWVPLPGFPPPSVHNLGYRPGLPLGNEVFFLVHFRRMGTAFPKDVNHFSDDWGPLYRGMGTIFPNRFAEG